MRKPFANSGRRSAARGVCGSMRMKKSLNQRKRKTINDRGHSPQSGRQHKARGGASEASGTPGTRTTKTQGARGAGDRLKEPKVSARDKFIEFLQANGIEHD